MTHTGLHEKNFEADIEQYLLTKGGYTKGSQATYDKEKAIDLDTLIRFVKDSQPKAWERFERKYGNSAKTQLYKTIQGNILKYGLIHTLRNGVNDFGIPLKLCFFAPTSTLNPELIEKYNKNILECTRQFVYSKDVKNSIDMVLSLNGIPVVAIELKNQFTNQDLSDSIEQWKTHRNPKEPLFHFDNRILAYFGCDLYRRFAHLCEQQVVVVLCAMNSCLHHAQIRLISMLLLMLFLLISPIFLYNSVKSRKMA